jgi:sodium-dependent dicarboxylate transporter 2/3/5
LRSSEVPEGERQRRLLGLAAGIGVFLALALIPSGLHRLEGFGDRPAYAAAVAAMMAIFWLTEALPIAVTACIPLLLFPALGVFGRGFAGDLARSAAPFLDAYIFLFLGGMTIGAAMEEWGLHRRVALHIMLAIGTGPRHLLLGMLVATGAVSLWISNTATAVMMLPIAIALVKQIEIGEGGRRLPHYGSALMLSVAYAANVGGIGTKIGTGTNSIFAGFLSEKLHVEIEFLRFMLAAVPFAAIFLLIVWAVLWRLGARDAPRSPHGRDLLARELAGMGPLRGGEKAVAVIFGAAALLWILGDVLRPIVAPRVPAFWEGFRFQAKHYEAWVAMGAALALLATRVLPVRGLTRLHFGALILLGGSFAMAAGIDGSGLSRWMARHLEPIARIPLFLQFGLTSASTILLSAIASNTATVNVMLNLLPRSVPLLFTAAIASSCDFALPAGTPPNAIVFGSGYVRLPTMMRVGVVLDVLAALLLTAYAYFYLRFVV